MVTPVQSRPTANAELASAAVNTRAEHLQSTPSLGDKLIPRSVGSLSAAETLTSYRSPLDRLLAANTPSDTSDNTNTLQQAAVRTSSTPELSPGSRVATLEALQQKLMENSRGVAGSQTQQQLGLQASAQPADAVTKPEGLGVGAGGGEVRKLQRDLQVLESVS